MKTGTPSIIEGSALALLAVGLVVTAGCSTSGDAPARDNGSAPTPVPVVAAAAPAAPMPAPASAGPALTPAATATSRVLSKKDIKLASGKPACDVQFVYGGGERDHVFWEEPCAEVTALMIGRRELEAQDDWEELDSFERGFVEKMPGGRVLYLAGKFSASIYPIDMTNNSIEVSVSD